MNQWKRLVTTALIMAALASVCCGQMRTWTDATGKHSVEAELVRLSGGKAYLRRADGDVIAVPLEKLSAADRACVAQQAASAAGKTPKMRTWTDATGTYKVEAALVGVSEGKVQLRRADGQLIAVPLEKLSAADRAYVARQTGKAAAAPESTPGEPEDGTMKPPKFEFHVGQRKSESKKPPPDIQRPKLPLWTLDLAKMKIPDSPACGLIHGHPFKPDRAELKQNGWLQLRQGKEFFPDLSLEVVLFLKEGEKLEGRTFRVSPKSGFGTTPHVKLAWREPGKNLPDQETYMGMMDEKYAMILQFGQSSGGKIPGRIYVCLPDQDHSVVAGTFRIGSSTAKPDLQVTRIYLEQAVQGGQTKHYKRAMVKNNGPGPASNVTIRFFVDGRLRDTAKGYGFQPAEERRVTASALPPGTHTVKVVVDPDSKIPETDETNNSMEAMLEAPATH